MENHLDWEQPNIVIRCSRTPRNKDQKDRTIRESLLSESTSGIVKGEDGDTTSVGTASFSSPELEFSARESNGQNNRKKTPNDHNEDEIELLLYKYESNHVIVNANQVDDDSDDEKRDDETEKEKKASIPDGGWGWVVVLSSFIISMIADGISFSFGLLYIEFLEEFKASKSTTSWIGSLFIAVPLLSGPVMSALVDRFGCRKMTILGGLISTLGFVLASMATSLEMMMITFGVIAGLGLGLAYVTAVVSIAYWFEKKRNLAVGLGACGTGVGTFIYAPLTQYLIETFGWRGTILVLSGTLLNICVCGCVMRDPEWWILEQRKQNSKGEGRLVKEEDKSKNSSCASISNPYVLDFDTPSRGKIMNGLIQKGVPAQKVISQEAASIRRQHNQITLKKKDRAKQKSQSLANLPTYLMYSDKVSLAVLESLIKSTNKENDIEIKYPKFAITDRNKPKKLTVTLKDTINVPVVSKQQLCRTHSDKYEEKDESALEQYQFKNEKDNFVFKKSKSENKEDRELVKQDSKENKRDWLKKQLSVNHHYLRDLKMPLNSISHRNAMLNIKRYRLKASSCPDIFKNSMITIDEKEENWHDDCVSCLADMFNVSLCKKMTFNCLCLGTIILFIWFIVPYFYLAEHMLQMGFDDADSAFMISLIGITNTIGMVSLGWIGDFPKVSIGNLYAVCLVLCGLSVAAMPLAGQSYWTLTSVCAAFGLLFAASFTFTPSLLVTLVSLDDFTSAYGLVLLAQGIGHLIGPPLSGLIYDVTSSWELAFYLAGGWIVVAGVLISFIQPLKNYQQRREAEESCNNSMA